MGYRRSACADAYEWMYGWIWMDMWMCRYTVHFIYTYTQIQTYTHIHARMHGHDNHVHISIHLAGSITTTEGPRPSDVIGIGVVIRVWKRNGNSNRIVTISWRMRGAYSGDGEAKRGRKQARKKKTISTPCEISSERESRQSNERWIYRGGARFIYDMGYRRTAQMDGCLYRGVDV